MTDYTTPVTTAFELQRASIEQGQTAFEQSMQFQQRVGQAVLDTPVQAVLRVGAILAPLAGFYAGENLKTVIHRVQRDEMELSVLDGFDHPVTQAQVFDV